MIIPKDLRYKHFFLLVKRVSGSVLEVDLIENKKIKISLKVKGGKNSFLIKFAQENDFVEPLKL